MSNIWFPLPVALFLRRVVNVLSTLSITHHYLLPPRQSTDKNDSDLPPSPSPSQCAGRIQWGNGRQEDERTWSTIVDNGLDGILQASGRLSIPWFRWPARLSLFHPPASKSADYVHQVVDLTRTVAKNDYNSAPPEPPEPADCNKENMDEIHRLMQNPVLYDPLRAPRYPIVLCHGLYGFDVRGPSSFPSLRMHYWSSILGILRKTVGAEVIVTAVPRTGSIASRAEQLDRFLQIKALGRGINFMAHSMGGLDCRHLITHLKPVDYTPLSLTTIATPHRGSPFMDWCKEYLGLGRRHPGEEKQQSRSSDGPIAESGPTLSAAEASTPPSTALSFSSLPSSFTTLLLGMFDSPAYANLTTTYLTEMFNPRTPDDPRVRYFSVAGRTGPLNIWHPLWLPKLVLNGTDGEEGNDGLVSVHSARWGEFLGTIEGADHWALRGASGIELSVDLPSVVGDGWGLSDWGRIVRGLGRFEWRGTGIENAGGQRTQRASEWPRGADRAADGGDRAALSSDEGLRSSTDRLSAVLDWLVEQVPVGTRNGTSFAGDGKGGGGAGSGANNNKVQGGHGVDSASKDGAAVAAAAMHVARLNRRGGGVSLESRRDLERLYVALARKLYDEGL